MLIHEFLHLLLFHALRRGKRDLRLRTICCDMAVNEHISIEMLPECAVTTKKIESQIKHKMEPKRSAEYYYHELSGFFDESFFNLLYRQNTIVLALYDNSILKADILNEYDIPKLNEKVLMDKLHELIRNASQNGELPPDLQLEIAPSTRRTKINWENIFKRFLLGRGRIQIRATYKRDSRRFEGFPWHKRTIGLKVLVALDESGSISDDQLQLFFDDLMDISRITTAEIFVTEFDSECSKPKSIAAYRSFKNRIKNVERISKQFLKQQRSFKFLMWLSLQTEMDMHWWR